MTANVSTVSQSLGRSLEPHEVEQVNWWIKGAELRIRSRLGDLDYLDQETLTYVVTEAVARKVRNPDGKRNERIDDYSYGYDTDAAKVDIDLTDTEWAMLTPKSNRNAFSIGSVTTPYYASGGKTWD